MTQPKKATLVPNQVNAERLMSDPALMELIDREVMPLTVNLADPNTGTAARKLVIEVTLKPTDGDDRNPVDVFYKVTTKLAPPKAARTTYWMGRVGPVPVMVDNNPRQANLFTPSGPTAVEPLGKVETPAANQ